MVESSVSRKSQSSLNLVALPNETCACAGRPVSRAVMNTVSVNIAFFILDDYFRLYTTVVTLSASKSTDSPADTVASVSFLLLVVV